MTKRVYESYNDKREGPFWTKKKFWVQMGYPRKHKVLRVFFQKNRSGFFFPNRRPPNQFRVFSHITTDDMAAMLDIDRDINSHFPIRRFL